MDFFEFAINKIHSKEISKLTKQEVKGIIWTKTVISAELPMYAISGWAVLAAHHTLCSALDS